MSTCIHCAGTIWRTTDFDGSRVTIWVDNLGTNFCPHNPDGLEHEPQEEEMAA